MYFTKFPYTFYTLDNLATVQLVKNILIRFTLAEDVKNNYSLYDEYDIRDGDTPELVADFFYNDPQLHWIILHTNNIIDPRFEWPLSTNNLVRYCEGKYENIYATHHYENADGYIVNSTYPSATPISNFQYEDRLNETKRRIKILKARYIDALVTEFNSQIGNVNG